MIIVIIVFILCLIIFIYSIYNNKLSFLNVKINTVEEKINSTLIKRKELIKESEKIIKETLNTDKEIYQGLGELSNSKIDMMELDKKLLVYINEFYLIKDKYKKLKKSEEFNKVFISISETEDNLNAYKEYYNDTIQKYNKLIKTFPMSIVSLFKRRKEKLFFDQKSMNDSDYSEFKY